MRSGRSSTHEEDLAWDLAGVLLPDISAATRASIFVKIGAGEYFSAIEEMLRSLAAISGPVPDGVLVRVSGWLNGYRGCEGEQQLRSWIRALEFGHPHNVRRGHRALPNEVVV